MKQSTTKGTSALILLLFCLTATDGFLDNDRRTRQDISNDRNFFGNTWQRFSGTLQERRLLPETNSRQVTRQTLERRNLQSSFDQRRDIQSVDDVRPISETRNERKSRVGLNNWRQAQKNSQESRQGESPVFDNLRSSHTRDGRDSYRESDHESWQTRREVRWSSDNSRGLFATKGNENVRESRLVARRDVRSASFDQSRDDESVPRQLNDRRRKTRSILSNRGLVSNNREPRLTRLEVRSVSLDRIRTLDNSRRSVEREDLTMTRQLIDRRREIQSTVFDRNVRNDHKPRSLDDNSRENDQEARLVTRREIRSVSLHSQRENEMIRQSIDRRQETRSAGSDRATESRQTRQLDNNSQREEKNVRQARLVIRRENRSISLDRSSSFDNRRENDRETRQIRREVRSRDTTSRRELNSDRAGENHRESPLVTRRQSQSVSLDRHSLGRDERLSREQDDMRRKIRSTLSNRAQVFNSRENGRESRTRTDKSGNDGESRVTREVRSPGNILRRIAATRDDRSASRHRFNNERESRRQFDDRINDREIRTLDRRLTREGDRFRRVSLSSRDENNNERQSELEERRMATSFTSDTTYIPEMKSTMLANALQVLLLSFLVAQGISNSSKTKNNWLTNFVTVTKEKVL